MEGDVTVTSGFIGLSTDFSFGAGGLHLQAFGAGRSTLVLDREGPLQDVLLTVFCLLDDKSVINKPWP